MKKPKKKFVTVALPRGTNEALRYMYLDFNKKYFHNALPKDLPVSFSKKPELGNALGHTAIHKQTFRPLWIDIAARLRTSRRESAMTLLHEMVHVEQKERRGHGKHFEKRMRELARHGAFKGIW